MASEPQNSIRLKTHPLSIVLDAEKAAMEAMEQMRPVLEAAAAAVEPVVRMASEAQKSFEAIMDGVCLPDLSEEETFIAAFPREYPTTEEIAEAVAKKMKLGGSRPDRTDKKIQIPNEAKWEDIRLDLKDNRSITVFYKDERVGNFGYEDFSLVRKSTARKVPDRQAEFLEKISFVSMPGSSFKATIQDVAVEMNIKADTCHQIKKSLAEKLRVAFGIHGDPFLRYDPIEGYRTRFALRPFSLLRGDGEMHASGGKLYEETTDYSEEDY